MKGIFIEQGELTNVRHDHVNYDHVLAKVVRRKHKNDLPQYCIELTGDHTTATLFAVSLSAFKKIKSVLASEDEHPVICLGKELLGAHIVHPPIGWPLESDARVEVLMSSQPVVAAAQASMPAVQHPKVPVPKEPGIQILDYSIDRPDIFIPYSRLVDVSVEKRMLDVKFSESESTDDVVVLSIILSSEKGAAQLKKLIQGRVPKRLTINHRTGGMMLAMGDHTWVMLGFFRFLYSPTKQEKLKYPAMTFLPHKMVRNADELLK